MKIGTKKLIRTGVITLINAFLLISCWFSSSFAIDQGENTGNELTLETMTVTAQKQEENVAEVPVSITAFDGLDIEDKDIDGIWKLSDHTPGLMIFDIGMSDMFAMPSMRGITASANTFTTSVGLYVDGVPILSSPGFTATLLDIERIEVLRGPQGTLYGKNTEAGAISIITRQPDNEWRGKTAVEFGEDDKRLIMGTVSGPITQDKLFFSLTGQFDSKDGFLENEYLGGTDDDRERYYGRGQLRWTPSADLDISLVLSRLASKEGGSPQVANETMMASYGLSELPDRTSYSDLRPSRDTYNDIQALKVEYDLNDSMRITSITARKMTHWYAEADFDFSPMHIYHIYNDSEYSRLSQEIRLNWQSNRVKGLIGTYGDKHLNDINMGNILSDDSKTAVTKRQIGGDSHALFGQVDYELTEDLHVIAGLRYEKQNMYYDDEKIEVDTDESWDKVTPKLSFQYRFSPQTNMYATVAEGYRHGGFNHTATDLEYRTYDPEKLWNYEVGIKTGFMRNRVVLNVSVYYMDIRDMQVEEGVSPIVTYITNAAEATSKGGEIELAAKLAEGFNLTAGYGYNETTFDSFKDARGDYSGNKNPFAPSYTFNLGAKYRNANGFYASADVLGYGDTYIDKDNTEKRDAYELVNAKVGYEFDRIDVYLYAENLFDEKYDMMNFFGYYNTYSPPREIGVRMGYRF